MSFRHSRRMVPAVHFGRHKEVVQYSAFDITAPMGKHTTHLNRGHSKHNCQRAETDNAEDEKDQNVAQPEVDRMGHQNVPGLQIRNLVMVGMELPKEAVLVLNAVHPITEKTNKQHDDGKLQPEGAQLLGRRE